VKTKTDVYRIWGARYIKYIKIKNILSHILIYIYATNFERPQILRDTKVF